MVKIDENFADYVDVNDPKYPFGKAINSSTPESLDGTPFLAKWMNDVQGARQALWIAAFGADVEPSGVPDNIQDSDVLRAIKKITETYTDDQVSAEASARSSGDTNTLLSAKSYTNTKFSAEASARSSGDANTLSSAKSYTNTKVSAEASARSSGDTNTLSSAKSYTNTKFLAEASARSSGDANTLSSAKAYADTVGCFGATVAGSSDGYLKVGGKFLIQWGFAVSTLDQGQKFYLPKSFDKGIYSVVITRKNSGSTDILPVRDIKKGYFVVDRNNEIDGSQSFFWIAIGV